VVGGFREGTGAGWGGGRVAGARGRGGGGGSGRRFGGRGGGGGGGGGGLCVAAAAAAGLVHRGDGQMEGHRKRNLGSVFSYWMILTNKFVLRLIRCQKRGACPAGWALMGVVGSDRRLAVIGPVKGGGWAACSTSTRI
jgi:hypothetical protein